MKILATRKGPGLKGVSAALAKLQKREVLVGIPQAENNRGLSAKIGNAALLFIHTNGSPVQNIPARPVIQPAIAADGNRQPISVEMKDAAKAQLAGDDAGALAHLRRAGTLGMNASKGWFTDLRNNWAPNRPATIRAKGSNRPLIKTGAMRKAITYVVRDKK